MQIKTQTLHQKSIIKGECPSDADAYLPVAPQKQISRPRKIISAYERKKRAP
jgi:hypothetical protein